MPQCVGCVRNGRGRLERVPGLHGAVHTRHCKGEQMRCHAAPLIVIPMKFARRETAEIFLVERQRCAHRQKR